MSRSVTTCAGMTAYKVVVAQTRVGFLTGGRKERFLFLPQEEQTVQLEEAYGRATVAITRARSLCLIMGPLDMKELLGAATVMGALMYGAGHVWEGHANFYLHDHDLARAPTDENFTQMLATNCCLAGPNFPPPAVAEVLQDCVANHPRPSYPRCRRYAFGYALDNSEFPCYLVWPQRDGQSYALLDTATNDTLQLSEQYSFRPLGIHHFYDSFAIVSQIGIREDALVLFDLQEEELLSDLHITRQAVLRKRYGNHQEQFLDQYVQEADRYKVPSDVLCVAAGEVASDSGDEEASIATTDSVDSSTD